MRESEFARHLINYAFGDGNAGEPTGALILLVRDARITLKTIRSYYLARAEKEGLSLE